MSPAVYAAFEAICQTAAATGPVLEVGAVPGPDSLLHLPALAGVAARTGLNREPFPYSGVIRMVTGDANRMDMFSDGTFGSVLCNATLEHDARFWLTLAEIRRVTAPGGLIVIGVPGFRGMGPRFLAPPRSLVGRIIALVAAVTRHDALLAGTVTLGEHFFPGDYYRFTEQAVREVFLEGLVAPQCRWVMTPPRIIGWGRKP
ncbi:MAG: class I SAM-dependent methyltransferase [Pirellulales bacterium]